MKIKLENVERALKEVKEKIIDAGGEFTGNIEKGVIYVKGVELEYKVKDSIAEITILSKPWLVTEDYIYGKIKEYFI